MNKNLCGGLAVVIGAAALLIATQFALQPHIEQQRQRHADKIYFDMLSLRDDDRTTLESRPVPIPSQDRLNAARSIYLARRHGAIIGLVIPISANGYTGPIDLLVGLDANGAITHVRATVQHESRGIGDAIDIANSRWIDEFSGKSANAADRVNLKIDGGDIDQITGATVTSRAVTKAVHAALMVFAQHRAELLQEAAHE